MSQVRQLFHGSTLYRRTLAAGIILGLLAVLTILLSNWFMQSIGVNALNSGNPLLVVMAQVYGFVTVACVPFSAALISAALVMRHLDNRLATLSRPGGSGATAEHNGG